MNLTVLVHDKEVWLLARVPAQTVLGIHVDDEGVTDARHTLVVDEAR